MKMCANVLVPWMNGSWESCWYCWFQLKFPRQRLARRNTANTGRLKQNTSFSPTQLLFSTTACMETRFFLHCLKWLQLLGLLEATPLSSLHLHRELTWVSLLSTLKAHFVLVFSLKSLFWSDQMNDPEKKGYADCLACLHLNVSEPPTYFQISLHRNRAETSTISGNVLNIYIILLLFYF